MIALWNPKNKRFVRMSGNKNIMDWSPVRTDATLPDDWLWERFLTVAVEALVGEKDVGYRSDSSGDISLSSGNSVEGNAGSVYIQSGATDEGIGSTIEIAAGYSTQANGGSILLRSGAGVEGMEVRKIYLRRSEHREWKHCN